MTTWVTHGVNERAKVAATEALITKLDDAISELYESYQYRRVDVDISGLPANLQNPAAVAEIRRQFLEQTIAMEMPQNRLEVTSGAQRVVINGTQLSISPPEPALLAIYRNILGSETAPTNTDPENNGLAVESAELLYMIITNAMPEMRELFHERDIGDVNGNGLPEFIDAWGKPIAFIRWAPGLPDSERQPVFSSSVVQNWKPDPDTNLQVKVEVSEKWPNPFDPLDSREVLIGDDKKSFGWTLSPLIISAGSDGNFDLMFPQQLCTDPNSAPLVFIDPFELPSGMSDGNGGHFDNIHNHRVSGGTNANK